MFLLLIILGSILLLAAAAVLLFPLLFTPAPPKDPDALLFHAPPDPLTGYWTGSAAQTMSQSVDSVDFHCKWGAEALRRGKKGFLWRQLVSTWMIMPMQPRDIQYILVKNGSNYDKPKSYEAMASFLSTSLINMSNRDHPRVRRIFQPSFTPGYVGEKYGEQGFFQRHVTLLLEQISEASDGGKVFHDSFADSIQWMTSSVISDLMYNRRDDSNFQQRLIASFKNLARLFSKDYLSVIAPPLAIRPVLKACSNYYASFYGDMETASGEISSIVKELVSSPAEEAAEHDRNLIDLMRAACKNGSLTAAEADAATRQISFAGQDTTAVTISFCVIFLAQNHDVQQKLFDELEEVMAPSCCPALSSVEDVPMLDAVIKETLRLCPAASGGARVALKDDVLPSGIVVPAGVEVGIGIQVIHTLQNLWGDDANEWKPGRWFTKEVQELTSKPEEPVFLPFSAGARDCLGRHLAMAEMKVTVAALVRTFHIDIAPGQPRVMKKLAFTTRPSYMPKMTFVKRK